MEISKEGIGGSGQRKINEGKARKMLGMIMSAGSREIMNMNMEDVYGREWLCPNVCMEQR